MLLPLELTTHYLQRSAEAISVAQAGNAAGLTIALTHCLFNLTGTLLIYPIPAIRNIPIRLATGLAKVASRSRWIAIGFVLGTFFVLPGSLILISRLF